MRGACVVHAWCMRGACVVYERCIIPTTTCPDQVCIVATTGASGTAVHQFRCAAEPSSITCTERVRLLERGAINAAAVLAHRRQI